MSINLEYVQIISVVVGLCTTIFTVQQNPIRWPIDTILILINLYIHHQVQMYDRWVFSGVIILINLYGWYSWIRGGKNNKKLQVSHASATDIFSSIFIGSVITFILYFPLKHIHSYSPFLGSIRTSFAWVAIWLASRKKIENWYIWMILNLLNLGLYLSASLYIFSLKYIFYIISAIIGYRKWKSTIPKTNISEGYNMKSQAQEKEAT